MNNYEKIKIIIMVIFTLGSLYILKDYSKNGEYVFHDKVAYIILNTRTGEAKDLRTGNSAFSEYKNNESEE